MIVGLPDAAVKESRDRVMTALINSGYTFTFGRTTINLAPADVKKEGPSFDLPIAIGMLAASEQLETDQLENFVMVGELALTGAVRPVKGVLPIALRARAEGRLGVLVPADNAAEAAVVAGLRVIPIQNLREAASFLEGDHLHFRVPLSERLGYGRGAVGRAVANHDDLDFADLAGGADHAAGVQAALERVANRFLFVQRRNHDGQTGLAGGRGESGLRARRQYWAPSGRCIK